MNNTTPYWIEERRKIRYEPLAADLEVDVLVIGGGITGVTAAYLLAGEGRSVALLERGEIACRDTGHTTAHLTYMTDTRLSDLVATFGRRNAGIAWDGGRKAMRLIESTVKELGIDCGLEKAPGYLAAAVGGDFKKESSLLDQEAAIAREMGFPVRLIEADPITNRPAIHFEEQMEFHPLRYLDALVTAAADKGAKIFENTAVMEFPEKGEAKTGEHTVRYQKVLIATHVPLQGTAGTLGAALFQTKLAPYTSYAIRARIEGLRLPPLIWSDTADPFLYLRVQKTEDGVSCVLGGEDHKTGQENSATQRYKSLEAHLARLFPGAGVTHRWSGQVVETVDGLPFIGPTSGTEFVATGFSGNGMTFGTMAASMFHDWIKGTSDPTSTLFDPSRRTASALGEYIRENKDYPVRMVTDRLHVRKGDPDTLKPGEAKVLEYQGERVAAHRDSQGVLTLCSAVCPHMGCIVEWNDAERTWDCPCHGSRFQANGEVIAGPAETDLKKCRLSETQG